MYDVERVICVIFQINFKQELSAYIVPSFFFFFFWLNMFQVIKFKSHMSATIYEVNGPI